VDDLILAHIDGSKTERLTTNGKSRYGAIRPSRPPVRSMEAELDFKWARTFYDADAKARLRPPAGLAFGALFKIEPGTKPPFGIQVIYRRISDSKVLELQLPDCASIADGFAKLEAAIEAHDLDFGETWAVIHPLHAFEGDEALEDLAVSGAIQDEARKRDWKFVRAPPKLP